MGLSHAEIIMLQHAQERAVQRQQSYQDDFVKFSELDSVENIITQMQQWQHTVAYIAGANVRSMSMRIGAYCRFRTHIHATIEHAFRGCLLVLHASADDAMRERRREQREWQLIEEARRFRLQQKG